MTDSSSNGSPHDTVLGPFVTFITILAAVTLLVFGERVYDVYKRVSGWFHNE